MHLMASMGTSPKAVPEETADSIEAVDLSDKVDYDKEEAREAHEVFQKATDGIDFRTVTWPRATIIFRKIQFAMSILAVPGALAILGAGGGALSIMGWEVLNTYTAAILGDFRNRHPECHRRIGRELVGVQILVAQILITAAGTVSVSTALNAVSDHGACTIIFSFVAAVLITGFSSVRTFSRLGWLTWIGFFTFFIAVFTFVVAVTQQDRPAAAPKTGAFDLGWTAIVHPAFVAGITASANIFISGSGSSMYLPVISEMKKPTDYRKACLVAGLLISTPAFGTAGTLFKKISYGTALPGLVIGVGIYQHVAAELIFVRVLRNTYHLQENTVIHWTTWLGANVLLGVLGFIIAEAVPILNYRLGLAGSLCLAPFSLMSPALLWMHDFKTYRSGTAEKQSMYRVHVLILLVGLFMVVGGTYGTAISIRDAYASGMIGKAFDCSDNSGS
ncbi:amino acid transporter [Acephala macrosclerotiorum]|nr:amino acid transporter [Acephala macrosclerotiorum]